MGDPADDTGSTGSPSAPGSTASTGLTALAEAAGRILHPIGWVAVAFAVLAVVFSTVVDTRYLIGNLRLWQWVLLLAVIGLSSQAALLDRIRVGIESVSSVTKFAAWVLVWIVCFVQLFNVVTRYGNGLVEQDIYYGEAVSVAWQSFALIAILGFNYGVRDGVNPRIDFWWEHFSDRTKATLDFTIHALLLLPFAIMAVRLLDGTAAIALGRQRDGTWPSGWRVWETWERSTEAGQLAVGPVKAMLLVAFALFGLQVVAELIKTGFVVVNRAEYGNIVRRDAPMRIE
ncbi:MAG: TRAP transporter small permease subunit [Actinomycetota bacterium]